MKDNHKETCDHADLPQYDDEDCTLGDNSQTEQPEVLENCEDCEGNSEDNSEGTFEDASESCEQSCESDSKDSNDSNDSNDSKEPEDLAADEPELAENPEEVIAKLQDDLTELRADYYNLRKEYTNYVRRSKGSESQSREGGHRDVIEALIPVLDDIDAARKAGDLQDGPFAAIADKLENLLATKYKVGRFGKVGDPFDPKLHEALIAKQSEETQVATISEVLQPGYKKADEVIRPTKVIVDTPA